ncbi:alpha/beta hydrolase family protein [Robiginitalea sp. IMCC43444]|uniref:alpha/beta hydrolase family protein n=1 Tax=Robiginitalea sp. IMCC43444 TaxID=3459121 RepID=UPI0040410DD8
MRGLVTISLLVSLCCCLQVNAQEENLALLPATGENLVGTANFEWEDPVRKLMQDSIAGGPRVISVRIWYPCKHETSSLKTTYAPADSRYARVETNSFEGALPISEDAAHPLVLIAPGRGTAGYLYSTIAEDLASHGYIVAVVNMPQIGNVDYADGSRIEPSQQFQTPPGMMGGPYEKVDAFFETPTRMGVLDLHLAVENISRLNSENPAGRFFGKIGMSQIGLFGHSLGGRIAGQFAFEEPRVAAYISMEGIPPRDIRYEGKLEIPVAMLCSSGTWPYARENYFSLIDNRSRTVFMLELEGFGHNSLTDGPYLSPSAYNYTIPPDMGIKVGRELLRRYFNTYLRSGEAFGSQLPANGPVKFQVHE